MKKCIAVLMCVVLMISIFSILGYTTDEEINIEEYTIYDLANMTINEKKALIEAFKEQYNPYNVNDLASESDNPIVSPRWTSGNSYSLEEAGTHELLTLEAIEILVDAGWFITTDATEALIITLLLAVASALPDRELDGIGLIYAGHFYDPSTGKNCFGSSTNTARTNFVDNFEEAIEYFSSVNGVDLNSEDYLEALNYVGRAIHFLQDAGEPHHSNNETAGLFKTPHSEFEKYVEDNYESFYRTATWHEPTYNELSTYVETEKGLIVYLVAQDSKGFIDYVNDLDNTEAWEAVATICVSQSITNTAITLKIIFDYCGETVEL